MRASCVKAVGQGCSHGEQYTLTPYFLIKGIKMCHREVQATSGLDTHLTVMADLHPLHLPPLPASGNHQSVFWILDKLVLLEQSENLKTFS